jgi:hypothetical protein
MSRLELVGVLPVMVYLTYMGMISVCFGSRVWLYRSSHVLLVQQNDLRGSQS